MLRCLGCKVLEHLQQQVLVDLSIRMLPEDLLADLRHVHLAILRHHRGRLPCGQLVPAPEMRRLATHLLALRLEILPHGQADAGQDVLLLLELLVAQVETLRIDAEGCFKLLHLSWLSL